MPEAGNTLTLQFCSSPSKPALMPCSTEYEISMGENDQEVILRGQLWIDITRLRRCESMHLSGGFIIYAQQIRAREKLTRNDHIALYRVESLQHRQHHRCIRLVQHILVSQAPWPIRSQKRGGWSTRPLHNTQIKHAKPCLLLVQLLKSIPPNGVLYN